MITKQDTDLILTRLACWTTNLAMKDHMLLPLLRDAQAHISAMQREINQLHVMLETEQRKETWDHGGAFGQFERDG
jgi:hypothetical protein